VQDTKNEEMLGIEVLQTPTRATGLFLSRFSTACCFGYDLMVGYSASKVPMSVD
jgi:hypothetical protein